MDFMTYSDKRNSSRIYIQLNSLPTGTHTEKTNNKWRDGGGDGKAVRNGEENADRLKRKERESDRAGETGGWMETDVERDRQTDRQTDRQRGMKTDVEKEKGRGRRKRWQRKKTRTFPRKLYVTRIVV